jgi:5-methylphenazine-1-carboxylate 1-monooxygenase
MDVSVIGGGIGGLSLALQLDRAGIDCRVYESAPAYAPLGAGVNLYPHAVRRLHDLGLEDALRSVAVEQQERAFFTGHGQRVYSEPCGRSAGYDVPHYSIHHAELHRMMLEAVEARVGPVAMSHHCTRVVEEGARVLVHFEDAPPARACIAVACDGFHSAVRHQFYPQEGPPQFGGTNVWVGVTRSEPFLTGASIARIGALKRRTAMIYPIRNHGDGTQTHNWVAELKSTKTTPNDWNAAGRLEDFIGKYETWRFDWLDVPDLIRRNQFVLEYPMVDRDPVERWTFGRSTLLGDAAHPMYPRGGNGAAQSILDGDALARALRDAPDPIAGLQAYEAERRPRTSRIVLANRSTPPDTIVDRVEELTGGDRFDDIDTVIARDALAAISERYKQLTSGDIQSVNR